MQHIFSIHDCTSLLCSICMQLLTDNYLTLRLLLKVWMHGTVVWSLVNYFRLFGGGFTQHHTLYISWLWYVCNVLLSYSANVSDIFTYLSFLLRCTPLFIITAMISNIITIRATIQMNIAPSMTRPFGLKPSPSSGVSPTIKENILLHFQQWKHKLTNTLGIIIIIIIIVFVDLVPFLALQTLIAHHITLDTFRDATVYSMNACKQITSKLVRRDTLDFGFAGQVLVEPFWQVIV